MPAGARVIAAERPSEVVYDVLRGSVKEAMLGTILEGAQSGDTGGYAVKARRYGNPTEGSSGSQSRVEGWNDLVGWIEE